MRALSPGPARMAADDIPMNRPMAAFFALAALLCATAARVSADSAKILENRHGDVSYQMERGSAVPVAQSASVTIGDGAVAVTGPGSEGAVVLPDSSQVLLGANTRIQLAFFNQADIATARFVIFNGKTRFEIRHPKGALANYTFSTGTGQIAVRGTDGDIELASGSLRVNVYDLSDPNLPVQVTTIDGRTFTIAAGKTLFAHYVNGVLQVDVDDITQQAMSTFNGDFGSPPPSGPQKPKKGGGGGGSRSSNGPTQRKPPPGTGAKREYALALVAMVVAILLLGGSFFGRTLFDRFIRTRQKLGMFPTTHYGRRRLAARQIDHVYVGRVLENPRRSRTQRNGRKRMWGFIEEEGRWLRVITLPDGTVHNAFYDKDFKFEDRVRPRH